MVIYNYNGDIMKKIFEKIGIITLLIGSFIYTNKTIEVVNNQDDIMIEMK